MKNSPSKVAGRNRAVGVTFQRRERLRRGTRTGAGLVAALVVSVCGACHSGSNPQQGGPTYPAAKVQGTTLDIQVVRDGTQMRLTNTSARKFGKSRLWINRWFSRDIEGLDVGQTLTFNLSEFKDPYGESFRAGGFFATRNPTRLVQAQLETADSMVGLVVVARGEE